MWVPVLLLCSIWRVASSQDNIATNVDGSRAQWGWQMSQAGPGTAGHYFVKLPQAEQQVRYVADGSGYHGAVAVTTSDQRHIHTTNFALGERAVELNSQIPNIHQNTASNETQFNTNSNLQQVQTPVEIYLLQQQYPTQAQFLQIMPNSPQNFVQLAPVPNFYYTDGNAPKQIYYNDNIDHSANRNKDNYKISNKEEVSRSNSEVNDEIIETKENGPVVRVFKDHKCSNDDDYVNNEEYVSNLQKASDIIADVPTFKEHNVHGNFGARDSRTKPTYQQEPKYKTDPNARSERFYYSTEISHPTTLRPLSYTAHEGISRLVASTQDLISNEDLLRINHAAERIVNSHSDDIIKPKRRSNSRTLNYYYNRPEENPRKRLTVTAKYGNIEDSQVNHPHTVREQNYQTSNEYKFASPIVVEDTNYGNYKQQIVENLMSTMVPYIENGYEIIDVRNNLPENNTYAEENKSGEDLVNITPRPVSQNYLAPITVALRLLNSNNTDLFNTVDDHETSDSEFISNTVESPRHTKTIVEIQESIPVEITHINDVEYHEYLDEGRSNQENPSGLMKSFYQKYLEPLDASKTNQINHYNINNQESNYDESSNEDSKETLESSENIQTEVQVQASSDKGDSYTNYYNTDNKIIQPIIIEKQVPVTTYVDRFIEKQVPYPEPVEVVKQVPVDRPVPVPVRYETIVEKPVEVTRYVDKPYPVEVLKPYPVEVRVPYPVEHKVYVDRPVHVPYPVEKIIEKQLIQPVPVPTPVGIPVGIHVPVEQKVLYPVPVETPVPVAVPIEKPVPVEKIVEKEVPVPYPVEKKVPYPVRHEVKVPVPYPVEKRIPYPVEKIVEKPITVTKVVEKHIKVPVPHPVRVEVPKPYVVDRIVEKKVPYPVHIDRIVERKVPVQVPYPVKTVVEKIVEKPVVVTKYIEKPYPVEKRVPYPVEKIVERKVPYPVHVPVEVKVPYVVEKNVQKSEPYQFEKVEPTTLYSYGITQEALTNVANYLRYQQEQYKQHTPNYVKSDIDDYSTQQQAESQRNYQIQLANAQLLKNLQNSTPVHTTRWGNQYASSYHYINTTSDINRPARNNYIQENNKYFGPPPLKNYNDQWEKNKEYTERIRRTDRTPKMTNLRIEYGGFKPPLIPSTEVDLDGIPINKKE